MVELTDIELFKDFIIITDNDINYDLHSDYECTSLEYDSVVQNLIMQFGRIQNNVSTENKLAILFLEARLANIHISFPRGKGPSTIDIIYRGRFEENGELREVSDAGERYFYFIFEDGDSFEVYSKKVVFVDNYPPKIIG
jgi:hypothetical protein